VCIIMQFPRADCRNDTGAAMEMASFRRDRHHWFCCHIIPYGKLGPVWNRTKLRRVWEDLPLLLNSAPFRTGLNGTNLRPVYERGIGILPIRFQKDHRLEANATYLKLVPFRTGPFPWCWASPHPTCGRVGILKTG